MRLGRIISNNNIGRLQVSVDIALRMDALKPVHQLKSNDYRSLNCEFTFLEWFFQLFQVYT